MYEERALAASVRQGPNAKATLANLGQMQAIAHVSSMIGVYMDVGEQEFILWFADPATAACVS